MALYLLISSYHIEAIAKLLLHASLKPHLVLIFFILRPTLYYHLGLGIFLITIGLFGLHKRLIFFIRNFIEEKKLPL